MFGSRLQPEFGTLMVVALRLHIGPFVWSMWRRIEPVVQSGCVVTLHAHEHTSTAAIGLATTSLVVHPFGHAVVRPSSDVTSVKPFGTFTPHFVSHGATLPPSPLEPPSPPFIPPSPPFPPPLSGLSDEPLHAAERTKASSPAEKASERMAGL